MDVQKDFRELLGLFNDFKVDYVVVGAYALAYHGVPRYTGDLDIFVRPDSENARQILLALNEFGFGEVGLTTDDFVKPDKLVQLGVAPVRVDLMTSLTGVTWKEAVAGRVEGLYGDVVVHYLGKKEFINNKKAIGRKKDLADIETLGEDI